MPSRTGILGLAAIFGMTSGPLLAQSSATKSSTAPPYPSQQIRLIVPFAAGGVTDLLGRMAGDHIKNKTGQTVIVENRPGAGGNTGLDQVAKAAPDGYTIGLSGSTTFGVNPHIYKQMPFDPMRDLLAVATIAEAPQILVVNAKKVPSQNLKEFIAYAKTGVKLNQGSAGTGTPNHLGADQIARQAGIELAHVPYRGGGPAVADLVAGNVEVAVVAPGLVIEHVKVGTLRVLAAAAPKRLPFLPDVPTTAEAAGLPSYTTANWFGIVAPAKTPDAVVNALNALISSMSDDKAVLERLARVYMLPMRVTPAAFAAMVKADAPKWEKVVRDAGIKAQ